MKTNRVIFYREPIEPELLQGGEILAVFIDNPYKENFDASHVAYKEGTFTGICPQYLDSCKIATKKEYADLELELTCLGMILEPLNLSLETPFNI